VLKTATRAVVATIPVGFAPMGVAFSPDGTRAYVANFSSSNVSVIATATNTVVATVTVILPFGVAVSPNGQDVYVSKARANKVRVIATATNTKVAAIPVGSEPSGLAIGP
jgi:YVTN family beta-propeller protein